MLVPHVLIIVLMKTLDESISFRMANTRENQFSSYELCQSQRFPEYTGAGKTATEAAFIIHMGELWNTQLLPDLDQEVDCVYGTLRGELVTGREVRDHIQGIEANHTRSTKEKVRHNIYLYVNAARLGEAVGTQWKGSSLACTA